MGSSTKNRPRPTHGALPCWTGDSRSELDRAAVSPILLAAAMAITWGCMLCTSTVVNDLSPAMVATPALRAAVVAGDVCKLCNDTRVGMPLVSTLATLWLYSLGIYWAAIVLGALPHLGSVIWSALGPVSVSVFVGLTRFAPCFDLRLEYVPVYLLIVFPPRDHRLGIQMGWEGCLGSCLWRCREECVPSGYCSGNLPVPTAEWEEDRYGGCFRGLPSCAGLNQPFFED
jgi:hypothetical protein